MNSYASVLSKLYFLLVYADGEVNPKELASVKQMLKIENLNEIDFNAELNILRGKDVTQTYREAVSAMKILTIAQRIRVVAWLCVVANADGFMERTEWQLIYKLYHKELSLPLNEIFAVQKELNKQIWEQSSISIL